MLLRQFDRVASSAGAESWYASQPTPPAYPQQPGTPGYPDQPGTPPQPGPSPNDPDPFPRYEDEPPLSPVGSAHTRGRKAGA